VQELLGQDPSVAALGEKVLARAGGNPFFIEELVQSMAQRGRLVGRRGAYEADERVTAVELPPTIQAVLSSRIDRLQESDRHVLQAAAVIGREFSGMVLARLTGAADEPLRGSLARLVADGFVVEHSTDGETTYTFRHPLTQEVAYHSQLSERRRRAHQEVARILEGSLGSRRNELAGLTAFHHEAGGQTHSAAKFWARAALWIGSSNPSQAIEYWRHVRELLRGVERPPDLVRWRMMACGQLLTLGWRRGMPPADAADAFEEAAGLAQMSGDVYAHALLLAAYGRVLVTRGSAEEFVARMEAARALTGSADSPIRVCITGALSQAHLNRGDLAAALAANDEAVEGLRRAGAIDPRLIGFNLEPWLLGMRAELLVYMGYLDEAAALLETVVPLATAERDPTVQLFPRIVGVELAAVRGDADMAAGHADAARDLAVRHETSYVQVYAAATRALACLVAGRWEEAVGLVSHALVQARATGSGLEHEVRLLVYLAYGYLRLSHPAPATAAAEEAVAIAVERGRRMAEGQAWLVLAEARLASGASMSYALEALERAEMLVRQTGAAVLEPYVAVLRSRLADAAGDQAAAAEWLREAAQRFSRLGARRYVECLLG